MIQIYCSGEWCWSHNMFWWINILWGIEFDEYIFPACPQHCAHMGRELGEEAQVRVQAANLPGEEGHPDELHLQPRREAHRSRLPGWHHPDLGQKPQRESSNTNNVQLVVNIGCLICYGLGYRVRRHGSAGHRPQRGQSSTSQEHWPELKMPDFKMHFVQTGVVENIIK